MEKVIGNAKAYINYELEDYEKMVDFMESALTSNLEVFFGGSCSVGKVEVNVNSLKDTDYSDYMHGMLVKVIKSDTSEIPFVMIFPAELLRGIINAAMGGDQSNQSIEFDDFDTSTAGEILSQAMNTFGSAVSLAYGMPIAAYSCEVASLANYAVLLSGFKVAGEDKVVQSQFDLNIEGFDDYKCSCYTNMDILQKFVGSVKKAPEPEPEPAPAPAPEPIPSQSAPVAPMASVPVQAESVPPVQNTIAQESNTMFRAPISKASMELLMNIPLEISIQIGHTDKRIKDVCDFTNGTVIELGKPVSEPVDVLANNHLIAHGEVVVLEDNFGIKITDVLDMKEILSDLDNLTR